MAAPRFRTLGLALIVVSGSAAAGIGLGLVLSKVAQAGDKPRTAGMSSTASASDRRRGSSTKGSAPALGSRVLAPGRGTGGAGPNRPGSNLNFQKIPFDPRTLPTHGKHLISSQSAPIVKPLPMWNYNVTASSDLGGGQYSGSIIGRDPRNHGKATTTIPVQVVPLVITIDNGGGDVFTYDPTIVDPCVPAGSGSGITDVQVITESPIFTSRNWTMNGVNVGNTQYHDAFQRAQFWSLVGGTPYHLTLSPSTLAAQPLSFGTNGTSGAGVNINVNGCSPVGEVFASQLDFAVFNLITGPLAAMINAGTLPIFLMQNVVMADDSGGCCILGYHNAFTVGPNLQVYSPFVLDTIGLFGENYTGDLSHEIGEAINDPTGGNPTPLWGNIGQTVGTCQDNFEVGDPLSPGFGTPTNSFTVIADNGLTYGLQELAFFSWFYGGKSLGAGGKYSNNGTLNGDSILCANGGGSN